MDTDYISNSVSLIERAINKDVTSVTDSSGKCLSVDIREHWTSGQAIQWKGRTIDLKAAYKQLHVHPSNRWASCITLYDPNSGKPALFVQNTLPFGSSSSVAAFNRFSRSLWALGCHYLKLTR